MAEDNSNAEVFVYIEGVAVPDDVVRVRVHPSVTVIPEGAFKEQYKLEEVVLCDGLLEIGDEAFMECKALQTITIPFTVTEIKFCSFYQCKGLEEVVLYEGNLQIIGVRAFSDTNIKRIKVPSTVTLIDNYAFAGCYELAEVDLYEGLQSINYCAFSSCISLKHITIPTTVTKIAVHAFADCMSLRDIAVSPNAEFVNYNGGVMTSGNTYAFYDCKDLEEVFDTDIEDQLINALKRRFNNLPIHKMIHYQSCVPVSVDQLNDATDIKISQRRSKLNPTGSQQDCLGMTPLHIMCSTVQNIELYKVLVTKYPETLVTEDRWGAVPLLYAIWGNAPDEIIQYLVETYKSIHPNHMLNWTEMVKTLGKANAPIDVIQKLLDKQQESFPEQSIDWDQVIDELSKPTLDYYVSEKVLRYLVKYSMAERISALGPRKWRDEISARMNTSAPPYCNCKSWLEGVRSKLSKYEEEYNRLKVATVVLELALWKNKIHEFESKKKRKRTEESDDDFREQCRISCGADIVIEHVLPFLMPDDSDDSESDSDGSSSSSDDDNESGNESE